MTNPLSQDGPSIFRLIMKRVHADPTGFLATSDFPKDHDDRAGPGFAPGLLDGLAHGSEKPSDVDAVVNALSLRSSGDIELFELESFLGGVRAIGSVDDVLPLVIPDKHLADVRRELWELARTTRRYEVAKWGIALGSRSPVEADETVDDLLLFARHPEFTLFAANSLLHRARSRSDIPLRLARLLSVHDLWGRYHLLRQFAAWPEYFVDVEIQRDIVVRAGQVSLDGRSELALARLVDLPSLMEVAADDHDLAEGLMGTIDGLLQRAAASPMDLDDPVGTLDSYTDMLETMNPSPRRVDALSSLDDFLRSEVPRLLESSSAEAEGFEQLAGRVALLVDAVSNDDILREMLATKEHYRCACTVIGRCGKLGLIDDLDRLIQPELNQDGYIVHGIGIEAYVDLAGARALPALKRIRELFAAGLPAREEDDTWQASHRKHMYRVTYAAWCLAMMEVGDDQSARDAARALHSDSQTVRDLILWRLPQSRLFGSELVVDTVRGAFERIQDQQFDPDGANPADVSLVIKLGDTSAHDWLLDHFDEILPPRDHGSDRPGDDPQYRMLRSLLMLAVNSESTAGDLALTRARSHASERTRECMASVDRSLAYRKQTTD
ncbi:MAG: hypothetical protein JWM90_514 [Thermoleophilia bacterium]|nr:hypothetical protein [Thermoleophilia bacterium]